VKDIAKKIIESTLEKLEKLEEFTLDQAPEICKELIAEREARIKQDILESIVIGGACLIAMAVTAYLLVFAKLPYDYEVATKAISVVLLFISFCVWVFAIGCFLTAIGNSRVLKAAPKVFVLRELRCFWRM
jgi:hypothetical protein